MLRRRGRQCKFDKIVGNASLKALFTQVLEKPISDATPMLKSTVSVYTGLGKKMVSITPSNSSTFRKSFIAPTIAFSEPLVQETLVTSSIDVRVLEKKPNDKLWGKLLHQCQLLWYSLNVVAK